MIYELMLLRLEPTLLKYELYCYIKKDITLQRHWKKVHKRKNHNNWKHCWGKKKKKEKKEKKDNIDEVRYIFN